MKQLLLARTSLHCNALYPLPQFEESTSAPFLIGQYELNESNKELREGRIDLVSLDINNNNGTSSSLSQQCSLGLHCGVFDIVPVWSTSSNKIVTDKIAAGCTDGTVKIINVGKSTPQQQDEDESTSSYNLFVEQTFEMGEEMVTSCFVHSTESSSSSSSSIFVASTHHKGTISILKQHENQSSTTTKPFRLSFDAHEYDAWSIAPALNEINIPESTVFFSGGDDAKLKLWDLRTKMTFHDESNNNDNEDSGNDDEDIVRCQSHCSGFGAGVVSIVPQSATTLLVGSYDEHVYTIDTRMLAPGGKSKPAAGEKAIVSKLRLGGGGWRLRELSQDTCEKSFGVVPNKNKKLFAVAAMQAGSEVFSFDSETQQLESVAWPGNDDENGGKWIHHTAMKEEKEKEDKEDEEKDEEKEQKKATTGEEPLIYDVCQLGQGGKFMSGSGAASMVTVSFYTNEVRCWRN